MPIKPKSNRNTQQEVLFVLAVLYALLRHVWMCCYMHISILLLDTHLAKM